VLVQREIRHEALQPIVFVLELSEPAQLADAQVGVLLLPGVERGFADAQLPADVADRRAGLDLPKRLRDLLSGELRALHRSRPFVVDRRSGNSTLVLGCRRFRGRRHP
jgi:hypothetical protein